MFYAETPIDIGFNFVYWQDITFPSNVAPRYVLLFDKGKYFMLGEYRRDEE
jgi:hypothetical protein